MKRDIYAEIKELKKRLFNGEIEDLAGIETYIELLYMHSIQNSIEDVTVILETKSTSLSSDEKELIHTSNQQKKYLQKLFEVLVLQELGVKFEMNEINQYLVR